MFKTKSSFVDVEITSIEDNAITTLIMDSEKATQALNCFESFFDMYPAAAEVGRYRVEMFKTIPRMRLLADVTKYPDKI